MNAREVLDTMYLGDDDQVYPPTHEKGIIPEKLAEAERETEDYRYPGQKLADDIRSEGVKTPLSVSIRSDGQRWLANGHHRLAVMHDKDPEAYFPVTHEIDTFDHKFPVEKAREQEPVEPPKPTETTDVHHEGIGDEWWYG
jgi:hypothetical protein